MHACFQLGSSAVETSEPTSKTRGNGHVLLLCNVSYCVSYRDNCIGILSYRGKMYRCRPSCVSCFFLFPGNLPFLGSAVVHG